METRRENRNSTANGGWCSFSWTVVCLRRLHNSEPHNRWRCGVRKFRISERLFFLDSALLWELRLLCDSCIATDVKCRSISWDKTIKSKKWRQLKKISENGRTKKSIFLHYATPFSSSSPPCWQTCAIFFCVCVCYFFSLPAPPTGFSERRSRDVKHKK